MQISWIQAFVEVTNSQNFTEAAEALYVSQSTLSKYIKSLETELDIVLFDRTTRSNKLTYAGEQIKPAAEAVCQSYKNFIETVSEYKTSRKNTIRLASTPIMHLYNFAEIIIKFQQQYPDIHLIMNESDIKIAMESIDTGKADVALIRQTSGKSYDAYYLYPPIDDELVVLCSKEHPIAKQKEVGIHDAIKQKLYTLQGSMGLLKNALERYDIELNQVTIAACMNGFAVANFLKYKDGISLMVRSMAKQFSEMDNLCIVPLKEHPPYPVNLVTNRKSMSFLTLKFVNYLLTHFKLT